MKKNIQPTRDELLERLAEAERKIAKLEAEKETTAHVSNAGAIAQDHSVAAGAGGIAIGGHVHGDVYMGNSPADELEAIRIYCKVLINSCRQLPLRGLDLEGSDPASGSKPLDLVQVYVDQDTKSSISPERLQKALQIGHVPEPTNRNDRVAGIAKSEGNKEEKLEPLPALAAVILARHTVILGNPGSGKSTFINHLGTCLALNVLEPDEGWLRRLPGWPGNDAANIPLTVVLRDFAAGLPVKSQKPDSRDLWDFIISCLARKNLGFAEAPLRKELEQGRAIILLDGMDEIADRLRQKLVRDAVNAFADRYPRCRCIVTCRTLAYQNPRWHLDGFRDFELAPFSSHQISRFIQSWYLELGQKGVVKPEESENLANRLQEAVKRSDIWRLVNNPLLLTVTALVHTHKGRLPDARAVLYEETVDILLWRWEQMKTSDREAPPLRQLLMDAGRTDVDLKRFLWRIAFEAHQSGAAAEGHALADIGELYLQKELAELHPDKDRKWAFEMIQAMKMRAGLLIERVADVYTFPHRTFQEYLAGAHLAAKTQFSKHAGQLAEDRMLWREVILLAVGRLVYLSGDTEKPLALTAELCPKSVKDNSDCWTKVWLAGEVLNEIGRNRVNDSELGRDLLQRVQGQLVNLVQKGKLTARERTAAGDSLGHLDDSRFDPNCWYLPSEPMFGFIEIPAGPFLMGSDKKVDHDAFADEYPQHSVDLPPYFIARYPVTIGQFGAFVRDSGYSWQYISKNRSLMNRPVVYVTLHDARQYCQWLTEKLRESPKTPKNIANLLNHGVDGGLPWQITLPSEAEWEKAARGGLSIPTMGEENSKSRLIQNPIPGRIYPWGNEADSDLANYDKTGIGETSPVGAFPLGASPYGCEDLSGNIWEWTRSLWGENILSPETQYPYKISQKSEDWDAADNILRVVRGGGFSSPYGYARCAHRLRHPPDLANHFLGFRVVLSPIFSSDP